ncbi:MAG: tRNA uridine-5-carboxymethylaminomethyl(34) synthesis GTPase MnmE [Veillonellales bacterium]
MIVTEQEVNQVFEEDTISAIATAPGEGGIGIVRVSGPQALVVADRLFRGVKGKKVQDIGSYQAAYGHIVDPQSEAFIDEVLLLVMRSPRSYTREDVVEIHCHGGSVPLKNILRLTLLTGARLADPGEFTKRAFLNGRLDLTQAEAVMDVIRAKTDSSLRMAMGQLSGRLSAAIHRLRHEILGMVAHLEAAIDFPEEDIEELTAAETARQAAAVLTDLERLLATAQTGRILRDGLETVIIGKPNVGKSSLLNALLGEERAIVTDVPGTTRDVIEEYVNIRGVPLKIVDTAGIRETADVVEQLGVKRARQFVAKADLVLLLLDASQALSVEDKEILTLLKGRQAVVLINKSDLPQVLDLATVSALVPNQQILWISVTAGTGLDQLEQCIVDMVYGGRLQQGEGGFVNNLRQADLLSQARQHLQDVLAAIDAGMPPDCIVIDLRDAWDKLGEITGDTVGEDMIQQIFTRFCIGK